MTRKPVPPTYDRYREEYARVAISRKSIHLGKYGSDESYQKYRQLIAEWSAGQQVGEAPAKEPITVAELLESYRIFA